MPENWQNQGLAQKSATTTRAIAPQGEADPDLAHAARDRIRKQAVNSDARQESRQNSAEAGEPRNQRLRRDRAIHLLFKAADAVRKNIGR
jgi:hypothetical protein